MKKLRVLLVGESWVSVSSHHKGFDHFSSGTYETGNFYMQKVFDDSGCIECTHMPAHLASEAFPQTMEELQQYDVVILSDIGSNTLLLSHRVFVEGKTAPNRLRLIQDWVASGGGFCMCGGYLSFSGIQASAKYYRTPIEEILPVAIHPFDDRVETPEGVHTTVLEPNHPLVAGIPLDWPPLLGYQETVLKEGATLVAKTQYGHPLIASWEYGKGRSLAWTTDIGPHWCPTSFTEWVGYEKFWQQAMVWLSHQS
ncbi:MAG: glutamine amidotransferase [Sphaerochaeta sp.]|nr:glutamine amidotransferase [Sphaerochaeta sp.]